MDKIFLCSLLGHLTVVYNVRMSIQCNTVHAPDFFVPVEQTIYTWFIIAVDYWRARKSLSRFFHFPFLNFVIRRIVTLVRVVFTWSPHAHFDMSLVRQNWMKQQPNESEINFCTKCAVATLNSSMKVKVKMTTKTKSITHKSIGIRIWLILIKMFYVKIAKEISNHRPLSHCQLYYTQFFIFIHSFERCSSILFSLFFCPCTEFVLK